MDDLVEEVDEARIVLRKRMIGDPEPDQPPVVWEVAIEREDMGTEILKVFSEDDARGIRNVVLDFATKKLVGSPSKTALIAVPTRKEEFEGTVIYTCTLPPDIDKGYLRIVRGADFLRTLGPGIKEGEEEGDCNPDDQIMVLVLRIPKEAPQTRLPEEEKTGRERYTVVGIYDDNDQVWVEHVEAKDPGDAIVTAGRSITSKNPGMDSGNVLIVSVFPGQLNDLNETESVASVVDFPGFEEEGDHGRG